MGPVQFAHADPNIHLTEFVPAASGAEKVAILEGFPASVKGRLVFLPQDNLNTDGIYGKDYTYREDMTPAMMAKVVMENYDPQFSSRCGAGDVIVGGSNFGTGSSRAGGHRAQGQRHSAGHRGKLLADLSTQCF